LSKKEIFELQLALSLETSTPDTFLSSFSRNLPMLHKWRTLRRVQDGLDFIYFEGMFHRPVEPGDLQINGNELNYLPLRSGKYLPRRSGNYLSLVTTPSSRVCEKTPKKYLPRTPRLRLPYSVDPFLGCWKRKRDKNLPRAPRLRECAGDNVLTLSSGVCKKKRNGKKMISRHESTSALHYCRFPRVYEMKKGKGLTATCASPLQ